MIHKFVLHGCVYVQSALKVLIVLMVFTGIAHALNYIYLNPDDSNLERIFWHNFYEDEGKIDNIYLGSSHVFCDLNPNILDDINGQYNFNMATPGQLLNGSYYILKEADRINELSNVYLELYYYYNVKDYPGSVSERISHEYFRNWQNTDYMRMSLNRLQYMFAIADCEWYADIFLPFVRYRGKLDGGGQNYIKHVVEKKRDVNYINYKWYFDYSDGNGQFEYQKKGYQYCTRELPDETRLWKQNRILSDENPLGEKSEEYLRKIIGYCKEKNLPLTLFVAPIHELELLSTADYDHYVDQIKAIADECDVAFYDFNLVRDEYLPLQDNKYFMDNVGHLNAAGATMFTPFFYEVVSGNEEENIKYFYGSYAEKLQDTAPSVYGLYYRDLAEEAEGIGACRNMCVASNREADMEYRILLKPDDGEAYLVQDYNENREFIISQEEHGICTIMARSKDRPDEIIERRTEY